MKVQEVILRATAKRLTWWQAAEIIGLSEYAAASRRRSQSVIKEIEAPQIKATPISSSLESSVNLPPLHRDPNLPQLFLCAGRSEHRRQPAQEEGDK
jgi:hypothetical protein